MSERRLHSLLTKATFLTAVDNGPLCSPHTLIIPCRHNDDTTRTKDDCGSPRYTCIASPRTHSRYLFIKALAKVRKITHRTKGSRPSVNESGRFFASIENEGPVRGRHSLIIDLAALDRSLIMHIFFACPLLFFF